MKENVFLAKNNKGIIASGLVFLAGMLGIFILYLYTTNVNKNQMVFTQNGVDSFRYGKPDIYITTEIIEDANGNKNLWENGDGSWGAVIEFYVHNNTLAFFQSYTVEIYLPKETKWNKEAWNGTFIHDVDKFTVIPADYNYSIEAHGNVKYGFVITTPKGMTPESFISDFLFYKVAGFFNRRIQDSPFFSIFAIIAMCGVLSLIAFSITEKASIDQKKNTDERVGHYIRLCASFIDVRDEYTKKHSTHVAEYSRLIAERLGKNQEDQKNIYYVGMLHDVGKVMISPDILRKPGKLNHEEWEEMKKHTTYGAGILQDFNDIPNIRDAVLYHHERFDGSGYMFGLKGMSIPEVARIICVADSYDAMATDRAYRPHLSQDVIIAEIKKNAGTQFDPQIADIAVELIEEGKFNLEV